MANATYLQTQIPSLLPHTQIKLCGLLEESLLAEAFQYPVPTGAAHGLPQFRVTQQSADGLSQTRRISGWNNEPSLSIQNDFGCPIHRCRNYRLLHGQGLDGRHWESFAKGGEHAQIC
jgi:hypothetical protein